MTTVDAVQRWVLFETADFVGYCRPSAAISGVRLWVDESPINLVVRDRELWPDDTLPVLNVYVPAIALQQPEVDIRRSIRNAVWAALGGVSDRERRCPTCRKPYQDWTGLS